MSDDPPRWLKLIWDQRKIFGNPTLREIEEWTQIPRSTLSRYFTGKTLPRQEDLDLILSVLVVDDANRVEITGLVRAARIEQRRTAGKRKEALSEPEGEIQQLAEAINRLVAAIEKLAER
jgi:transcriptional regulator with XRE-family HTH domain